MRTMRAICFCLAALLAQTVGAQKVQLDTPTGGGEISQAGGVTLYGAVMSMGLPNANRGVSGVGSLSMKNNFYPALSFALVYQTAADPLWLRMEARGTGAPRAAATLARAAGAGRGEEAARLLELEPRALACL